MLLISVCLPFRDPAQGFVRSSSPPRHLTSIGGVSSCNDVVVDGVRILGEKYVVQHVVGEGAYGLVMKCQVVGGGKHVAIKSFKIEASLLGKSGPRVAAPRCR